MGSVSAFTLMGSGSGWVEGTYLNIARDVGLRGAAPWRLRALFISSTTDRRKHRAKTFETYLGRICHCPE